MVHSRVNFSLVCQSFRNRQRPKHDTDVPLRPRAEQSAAEIPQIDVPERKMEQDRRQAALPHIAQHRFPERRRHKLATLCARELGRLREQPNDMQRQEVRLVDYLVKPKRSA